MGRQRRKLVRIDSSEDSLVVEGGIVGWVVGFEEDIVVVVGEGRSLVGACLVGLEEGNLGCNLCSSVSCLVEEHSLVAAGEGSHLAAFVAAEGDIRLAAVGEELAFGRCFEAFQVLVGGILGLEGAVGDSLDLEEVVAFVVVEGRSQGCTNSWESRLVVVEEDIVLEVAAAARDILAAAEAYLGAFVVGLEGCRFPSGSVEEAFVVDFVLGSRPWVVESSLGFAAFLVAVEAYLGAFVVEVGSPFALVEEAFDLSSLASAAGVGNRPAVAS